MPTRAVLTLFVIAVLVGWMMPDLAGNRASQDGTADARPAEDQSIARVDTAEDAEWAEGEAEDWEQQEIILKRQRDGHFYADVDVNDVEINFLVDTGASVIALTANDADALGFYWDPYELTVVGRGASGDVIGKQVTIDHMQLGGLSARNVPAVIIPEGLDRSLLGQAFLKQVDNVNISGDRMVLR